MLQSVIDFWYMWLVLAVLIVITIFVGIKASKAVKKKNQIMAQQREQLERMKMLVEKYQNASETLALESDAKELCEGMTACLQYEIEKAVNPDEHYNNSLQWRKTVYALFYFDEDVTADSLSFFFKNNAGPVPLQAVKGLEETGNTKLSGIVNSMYAMYDDKNESVSIDYDRISELDKKFSSVYDRDEFFENIKNYIVENI